MGGAVVVVVVVVMGSGVGAGYILQVSTAEPSTSGRSKSDITD